MKIETVVEKLGLKLLCGAEAIGKQVEGVYICDLLSWVMGNGKKGDVWITVQTHLNIIAVASLLEMPMIIVPECIEVETETLEKAEQEGIVICQSDLDSYALACGFNDLGLK